MTKTSKSSSNKNKIIDGNSKNLYSSNDYDGIILSFKDNIYLHDKIYTINGKGVINNLISSYIMTKLHSVGVKTHFISRINMQESQIVQADILPFYIVVNNISSGRYVTDFGFPEGFVFDKPHLDIRTKIKNGGPYNYSIINDDHLINQDIITHEDLEQIKKTAYLINAFVSGLLTAFDLRLVEIKLEFGFSFLSSDNFYYILTDEISLDTCKIWDLNTNEKFGYESIDKNNANNLHQYQSIAKRIKLLK
jgi:phosphoribosylaminoimidazole-succinocarboxamide synthase